MFRFIVPTLVFMALLAPATAAGAIAQDQVYDPTCVSRIAITAPQTSIDNLYADPKGDYQPATMLFDLCGDGTEVSGPLNVTFRLKGSGSFRTLDGKAAFKVKMPSGQRIDGLKSLTLNNMVQDPSAIHEALAYEAFHATGVGGPRAGYATVTVNGADYGLHANIETVDSRFLAAHFPATQHLYEAPDHLSGNDTIISRDIVPDAVEEFQVEEGDDEDLADLTALAAISQLESDDEWWTAFQQHLHADQVLRHWATDNYIGGRDGYINLVNNYFLHSDADGRFRMLPWGTDQTFWAGMTLGDAPRRGIWFNRCMAHAPCNAAYLDALDAVAETVISLDLVGRANEIQTAIAGAVAADTRMEVTPGAQCRAADATVAFLIDREAVWDKLFRSPGAPESAQSSQRIDCSAFDEPVSLLPPGPPAPDIPAIDSTAPQLQSVGARRNGFDGRKRRYSLRVRATDDTGVTTVQIRTFGTRIHSRAFGTTGRVALITAATRIRVRVVDPTGNTSAWRSVALPR